MKAPIYLPPIPTLPSRVVTGLAPVVRPAVDVAVAAQNHTRLTLVAADTATVPMPAMGKPAALATWPPSLLAPVTVRRPLDRDHYPALASRPRLALLDTFPGGRSVSSMTTPPVRGLPTNVFPASGPAPLAALDQRFPDRAPAEPTTGLGMAPSISGDASQVRSLARIDAHPERPGHAQMPPPVPSRFR